MRFSTLASALLTLLPCISAQTASFVEPGVPTGTPVPGKYNGPLRNQAHFSPPKGFMNDPNGMFLDAQGTYHLYYQYNPTDIVAGNQHWGHATSKDLYTWINQPIAIFPGAKGEAIFSGSCVVDVNNTSGFFPNQKNGVVAMYTLNTDKEQTQEIAYSFDNGFTFHKYAKNPVISIGSTQFRDPKVIWHAPTKHWVVALAYAQEFTIGFFTSPDLKTWKHASNFTHVGLLGLQYECPNLVALPALKNASLSSNPETLLSASNLDTSSNLYVLLISLNPGAPLGGSITEYFPGHFNGTHFMPVDTAARIADFGKDNYAGQFFYGIPADKPQLNIAWASNWQYSQIVPTGEREGFRSSMTTPRAIALANITRVGWDMMSIPYNVPAVHHPAAAIAHNRNLGNKSMSINFADKVPSRALSFLVNITNIAAANVTGTVNFTLSASTTKENITGGFFIGGDAPFFLDRGKITGFNNPFFVDKVSTSSIINPRTMAWSMQVIVDRSLIEVFLEGGQRSATQSFFGKGQLDTLTIGAEELNPGTVVSYEVYGLRSTWAGQEDAQGNVVGNVTKSGGKVRREVWTA